MIFLIQMNKRLLVIPMILVLLLGIFTGCDKAPQDAKVDENVIARVNGKEIDYESFKKNFNIIERRYNELYTENIWSQEINEKTVLEIVREQVLDKLITEELISQKAEADGITVDESKIEETYNSFKENLEKDEELKKFYEENNLDEEFIKKQIRMEFTVVEYETMLLEEIQLDDKKLDEMIENYVVQVSASHILLKDEKKAEEILAKVKAGEDFTTLANEHSEDTSVKDNNGNLGYFPRGMMASEFEEAAFSLDVGVISELVKTDHGYHIIKVNDKKTIKDLRDEISEEELAAERENVKARIIQNKFIERIEELKSEAKIEKFPENLK